MTTRPLILAAVFSILFFACKKDKEETPTPEPPAPPAPVATAIGSPNGAPVSQVVDNAGGTIVSSDGLFEVIIPSGALAAATTITIQPITNECHGGITSTAYRFSPDALVFNLDVTLRYHYTPSAVAGTHPFALGMAYQLSNNTWAAFADAVTDTVNHTVSIDVNHFTDYSVFTDWKMEPASANVNTGATQSLTVKRLLMDDVIISGGEELAPLVGTMSPVPQNTIANPEWEVNGIVYGDLDVGFIQPYNLPTVTYNAPDQLPAVNPVAVSLKINVPGRPVMYLVSNLTIAGSGTYRLELEETNLTNTVICYCLITNYNDVSTIDFSFNGSGDVVAGTPVNAAPTFNYVGTPPGICTSVTSTMGTAHINTVMGHLSANNMMSLDIYLTSETPAVTSSMFGAPCNSNAGFANNTLNITQFNTLDSVQVIPTGFGTLKLIKL